MALEKIGGKPLEKLGTNKSAEARLCALHYHAARRETLSEYPWDFAIHRITSSTNDKEPEDLLNEVLPVYRFPLPDDCLRLLKIEPDNQGWKLQDRCILFPAPNITYEYIADVEDEDKFPLVFINAFVLWLARKLAVPLTGDMRERVRITGAYVALIQEQVERKRRTRKRQETERIEITRTFKL